MNIILVKQNHQVFIKKPRNTVSKAHKMIPPLPHVLYGQVLVLLWDTPKSCR